MSTAVLALVLTIKLVKDVDLDKDNNVNNSCIKFYNQFWDPTIVSIILRGSTADDNAGDDLCVDLLCVCCQHRKG